MARFGGNDSGAQRSGCPEHLTAAGQVGTLVSPVCTDRADAGVPPPSTTRGETTLRRRPPLTTVAGLATIVVGLTLALVAYAYYPWAFSPAANWISDLGNTLLSPRGSVFFRLDMIALGAVLAAFFAGLHVWSRGQGIMVKLLVAVAQLSGFVGAVAVAMTGIFSENNYAAHALWATVLFIALAAAVWFIGWAPVWHSRLSYKLSGLAFAVCAVDVISVVERRHWLEWLAVGLLLCFVGAVALGTWSLAPSRLPSDR
jgi:hypothetical protein